MKLSEELERKLQSIVHAFLKKNGLISDKEGVVVFVDKHPVDILNTHLTRLGLKGPVITPLYYGRTDIKTVGDVMREVKCGGDNFICSVSGFGFKSFRTLRAKFQELGLKLGAEWKISQDVNEDWEPDA